MKSFHIIVQILLLITLSLFIYFTITKKDNNELKLPNQRNSITVNLYNDEVSKTHLEHLSSEEDLNIRGVTYLVDGECYILARTPRSEHDFHRLKTLGHELLHCYLGQYHNHPY